MADKPTDTLGPGNAFAGISLDEPGRPVMSHMNADGSFSDDPDLPDHSDDIMSAYGLGGKPSGDGGSGGQSQSSSDPGAGGEAAPPPPAPAANGEPGQTPPPAPDPNAQPAGAQPQPQVPPQPGTPPAPGSAEAPAGQPALTEAQELAILRAQVEQLTQLLNTPGGVKPPAAQPPAQPGAQSPTDVPSGEERPDIAAPAYQIDIPDPVVNTLFGEDGNQAKAALVHIINSNNQIVHARVMQQVDQLVQSRLEALTQVQSAQASQQQIEADYFGAFPQHNHPSFKAVVASEAAKMWAADPNLAWNETSRNALGARVNAALRLDQTPATPAPPPPPPPPAPPQRHAPMFSGGPRESQSGSSDLNGGEFIRDILTAP